MEREVTKKLIRWKEKGASRLPLIIYGARQVGKTYIIKDFGATNYKNVVCVNFERMPIVTAFFDGDISPNRIIPLLESYFSERIVPEQTLILFDEIQVCERALTALKYFAEEAPEYNVIAAGSLLGVAINRGAFSFPVGKVEIINMYPLSFEEFLNGIGKKYYIKEIRDHFINNYPMPKAMHNELIEIFRKYLCVGGMPAVINEYLRSNDLEKVAEVQNYIINSYIADMAKYSANNDSVKIRATYDSIPAQLYKENKKFQYKVIKKGANANLFGGSIDWLVEAGVVLRCKKVESGKEPLSVFVDLSAFKIYLSDVGLLTAKVNLEHRKIITYDINSVLKGGFIENYVAQTLVANQNSIFYWESKSKAEVDFVIEKNGCVIPIEVKANLSNKSKSLIVFNNRYNPKYMIRISGRNFGFASKIKAVPLYAAFCI